MMNWRRVLLGGGVAGALLWLLESVVSQRYLNSMQTALRAHGLFIEPSARLWFLSILIALLVGLTMVFVYAAVRPRFGPGPRTATIVAVVLWLGGYVPALIGFDMIDLFPRTLLYVWGLVGLLEMILANFVGAWVYREAPPVP